MTGKKQGGIFPLEYLLSKGVELVDPNGDCLDIVIKKESEEELHNAIVLLPVKQQEIIEKVYFDQKSIVEIANENGVKRSSIYERLEWAINKLKKYL